MDKINRKRVRMGWVVRLLGSLKEGLNIWYGMTIGEYIAFGQAHLSCCITCNITRVYIFQLLKSSSWVSNLAFYVYSISSLLCPILL